MSSPKLHNATSQKSAKEIFALATQEKVIRDNIFKTNSLKIHWDRQGKHIIGHRNYEPPLKRSILTHSDPQKLVNKYAGKGRQMGNKLPGEAGYKELIDFEEPIGYFIDIETGESSITTWGSIDYSFKGVHIVPRHPR